MVSSSRMRHVLLGNISWFLAVLGMRRVLLCCGINGIKILNSAGVEIVFFSLVWL